MGRPAVSIILVRLADTAADVATLGEKRRAEIHAVAAGTRKNAIRPRRQAADNTKHGRAADVGPQESNQTATAGSRAVCFKLVQQS